MQDQLDSWWRSQLSPELRDRLLAVGDGPLPPALALDVWRRSGRIHAVDHLGDHAGTWEWRLAPDIVAFLRTQPQTDLERGAAPEPSAPERRFERSHGQS